MTDTPFEITVDTEWPYLIVIHILETAPNGEGIWETIKTEIPLDRAEATFIANSILTAVERSEGLEIKFQAS